MEPLVTVGPGNELEAGIFPGVDQLSSPFWADGENIEFRKGGVDSSKGYELLSALPGTVNELAQAYHLGDKRVYSAVGSSVYLMSSVSGLSSLGNFPTVGKPYFETFGSFLLATNFVDPIMVWRNTGVLAAIAAVPFTFAKLLHRRDNHVIALNTSNGQNAYEWCSASNIDDWTPSLADSAGNNFIRDLDSEIVAVCDIGQATAVYSRETMGLIQFVGQPNVFAHTPAINGVGAVGRRSVVQFGAQNGGLNRQGIFITDGGSFEYVDEPAVHDYLKATVDFEKGEDIRGYHNEDLSSLIFFFTTITGARRGIGFDYKKRTFRKYTMAIEAALERQVFDYPIAALGNQLVLLNKGHSAAGAPLVKWIRTKPISAQDGSFFKIWALLKSIGQWNGATVKFGVMVDDNPNGTVEWFSTQNLTFETWIDRDAVFVVMEFRADVLDSYFAFSQLQLHGGPAGAVGS